MKLIMWDFDGTLVDSRPLIVAGMQHGLNALGLGDRQDLMDEWMKYVGLPVEDGLNRTFAPLGMDLDVVLKAYRSYDWAGNEDLIQPFPGMKELIQELHGLGQKMGIATSKRTIPLKRQLELFGWGGLFDPIVTPDQVQKGKPDPESLEVAMKATGLAPADLLMIGDTPFDLGMARSAGVPSVGVGHGFYTQEALLPYQPVAFAPEVASLREILLAMIKS